jgi:vitamin B12 transporter
MLFSPFSLRAQSPEKPADAVVVTAGRIEQQITDAIPHTTVITQKDIRESQATDLIQLLRREAGFEFVQNGGIGSVGSIFMRGGGSTSTLVLVDGMRVDSATTGSAQVGQIMLDQIDHVEIARGNVSAMYGANAAGGVIQIFTKRGQGVPRAEAEVMLGARSTRRASGSYGGQSGDTRFSLNVSEFETRGFTAQNPRFAPANINPDADGYTNQSISAQVAQTLAAGHELGLRAYQSKGHAGFDSNSDTPQTLHFADSEVTNLALYSRNQISSAWTSKLTVSKSQDDSHSRTNGATPTRFDTATSQTQWQNDFTLARGHVVTATLDDQKQRIASSTAYNYGARNVSGLSLGYIGRIDAHQFQLASRADKYSDFGKARTWLAGYGYDLNSDWKLTAMRSTAFRAPTFNELFFPGFANPALKPESSQSNEVGVQYAAGEHLLRVVQFSTKYVNLIQSPAPAFLPVNAGKASVDGTEMSYTGQYAKWDLRASLTLQDPIDATGAQLTRRSQKFGNLVANTGLWGWRVGGELAFSDKRPDGTAMLGSYKTLNLTARRDLGRQMYVAARLENVFDEEYQTAFRFNQPSRGLYLTVGWRQ